MNLLQDRVKYRKVTKIPVPVVPENQLSGKNLVFSNYYNMIDDLMKNIADLTESTEGR